MSTAPDSTVRPSFVEVYDATRDLRRMGSEIAEDAERLVDALATRGVHGGDTVALLMDNRIEYLVVLDAMSIGGFNVVAVNTHLSAAEIGYILEDSNSELLVTTGLLAAQIADHIPASLRRAERVLIADGEDAPVDVPCESFAAALAAADRSTRPQVRGAMVRYTSGTTGRPKAIELIDRPEKAGASRDFVAHTSQLLGMDEQTRLLITAPLYHSGPQLLLNAAWSVGGSVVLMNRFDAETALSLIESESITHSYWVPTMFGRLLRLPEAVRERYDLSTLTSALHVGAPCSPVIKQQMLDWWGPVIHEFYGGSEGVGMTYASPHDWLERPGTVGRPIGCEVHICDSEGNELEAGETGIVYFDTGSVGFAYRGDDAKLRDATHPRNETWLTLGDVGRVDADGFIYLTDRSSGLIVSGGVNVYAHEVEAALVAHPGVVDAAVTGVPDDDLGEVVAALVEIEESFWSDPSRVAIELSDHVGSQLARFKRPRLVAVVDEVPRQPSGKMRHADVRRAWQDVESSGAVIDLRTNPEEG